MKLITLLTTAVAVVMRLVAATATVNGITWQFTVIDGKAEICYDEYSYKSAIPTSTTGAIAIPSSIYGYPVLSIGKRAFLNCSSVTSVTIPYGIARIGDEAFSYCSGMTSVTIPNSVTNIGNGAFEKCTGLESVYITDIANWTKISFGSRDSNPLCYAHNLYLNGEKITNLTIPDSVTSIGSYAFYNCSGLAGVTIPDGVTSIGASAFGNCSGLTSVTIPDSVTSIGSYAFSGCSDMRGFYLWDASSFYVDPKTGKEKSYKYKQSFPVILAP